MGWVDFFYETFERCKNTKNSDRKKLFEVTTGLRKGCDLTARYIVKIKKKFAGPGHVIHKKRRILRRFQNCKLTFVTK
jgi:hypothetical protein